MAQMEMDLRVACDQSIELAKQVPAKRQEELDTDHRVSATLKSKVH